jgi:hypothetical protein
VKRRRLVPLVVDWKTFETSPAEYQQTPKSIQDASMDKPGSSKTLVGSLSNLDDFKDWLRGHKLQALGAVPGYGDRFESSRWHAVGFAHVVTWLHHRCTSPEWVAIVPFPTCHRVICRRDLAHSRWPHVWSSIDTEHSDDIEAVSDTYLRPSFHHCGLVRSCCTHHV